MAKYCPNCYVGIKEEDQICANCSKELSSDKEVLKETFEDVSPVEGADSQKQEIPIEDPKDSADIFLAQIIEDHACERPEETQNPFEKSQENEALDPIDMGRNYHSTFEESDEPSILGNAIPDSKVMGLGEWLITLLLVCIPIVNLVMLIYWSAGNDINQNKKNFARAQLIIMAVGMVISFFFFGSVVAMIFSFNDFYY